MRAGLIEALHAADPAEEMLGGTRAEAVARQRVCTGEEGEILVRHDEVPETRRRADRAITVEDLNRVGHLRREADGAAMAAAFDLHRESFGGLFRRFGGRGGVGEA